MTKAYSKLSLRVILKTPIREVLLFNKNNYINSKNKKKKKKSF